MSLEELLRDVAARGELVHFSLWFEPIKDRWCATYSPSHVFGVSRAHHKDPVTAAVKALEGIAHARSRKRNVIEPAPEQTGAADGSQADEASEAVGATTGEEPAGEGVRPEA